MGSLNSKTENNNKQNGPAEENTGQSTRVYTPNSKTFNDPRSPSANIVRTPIQIASNSNGSETPIIGVISNYDDNSTVNIDPRSPAVEFSRTPIEVGNRIPKVRNKNLDSVRQQLQDFSPLKPFTPSPKDSNNKTDNILTPEKNILGPILLGVSPVIKKSAEQAQKRKSYIGFLETNLDFVETDIDRVNSNSFSNSILENSENGQETNEHHATCNEEEENCEGSEKEKTEFSARNCLQFDSETNDENSPGACLKTVDNQDTLNCTITLGINEEQLQKGSETLHLSSENQSDENSAEASVTIDSRETAECTAASDTNEQFQKRSETATLSATNQQIEESQNKNSSGTSRSADGQETIEGSFTSEIIDEHLETRTISKLPLEGVKAAELSSENPKITQYNYFLTSWESNPKVNSKFSKTSPIEKTLERISQIDKEIKDVIATVHNPISDFDDENSSKDFDKKITSLIYEDEELLEMPSKVAKSKSDNRTPLSERNVNQRATTKIGKLTVSDKPKNKHDFASSRIPVFKEKKRKSKMVMQCENTPPKQKTVDGSRVRRTTQWDGDSTLII